MPRLQINTPIQGLHPAKTPLTGWGEILETLAEVGALLVLFGGALYGMPLAAMWLCANL